MPKILKRKNKINFMEKNQILEDLGEKIIFKLKELNETIEKLKRGIKNDWKELPDSFNVRD